MRLELRASELSLQSEREASAALRVDLDMSQQVVAEQKAIIDFVIPTGEAGCQATVKMSTNSAQMNWVSAVQEENDVVITSRYVPKNKPPKHSKPSSSTVETMPAKTTSTTTATTTTTTDTDTDSAEHAPEPAGGAAAVAAANAANASTSAVVGESDEARDVATELRTDPAEGEGQGEGDEGGGEDNGSLYSAEPEIIQLMSNEVACQFQPETENFR